MVMNPAYVYIKFCTVYKQMWIFECKPVTKLYKYVINDKL